MANLILNGSTSGSVTLSSPAVSGTTTLTLPSTSGTVITTGSTFGGTGPTFGAYRSGTQSSVSAGVWTKVNINAESWDTNNNFDSTTNYRFTPTVAGYYQINGGITPTAFSGNYCASGIYKNGTKIAAGSNFSPNSAAGLTTNVASIVYLNGSTDYVELYVIANGTPSIQGGEAETYFNGAMIRSA
jgi:hypothetical protein